MWSAVNALKNSPNISDLTSSHDKQLALFDINGNLASKYFSAELTSV